MKKVLILEDERYWWEVWRKNLDGKINLLFASSVERAKEMFAENPDLDAIVVDACVPGDYPNTQPLVREFRKTFRGPIIAISSSAEYRDMLCDAGCNYESEKGYLFKRLLRIFGFL